MRVLFACWPFQGHVFPQLAIARALRNRGHAVACYSGPAARAWLEEAGADFFGFDALDADRYLRVHEREAASGVRRQSLRVEHQAFRDWLVETIPAQVADVRAVVARWRPDVIVCDLTMWGPLLVLREADRIPVAGSSTLIAATIPGPDAPPFGFGVAPARGRAGRFRDRLMTGLVDLGATGLRRRVDELRAAYGLGPLGVSVNAYGARLPLYLVPSVPELDYRRRDLPASVAYVGPSAWFPAATGAESTWLDTVPTDLPWVHVTEGTSHHQDPFLLRAARAGLPTAGVRVIATTGGRDPVPLGLGDVPDRVHLTRWLSHGALLPRCAAVVTTGGAATVRAALAAGKPLVVVPTTWDKPDNAQRVVDAGAGVRLSPRRCTPAGLRAAVEEVLGTPAYATSARALADALAQAPGPAGAARLLEDLATPAPMSPATPITTPGGPHA